MSIVAIVLTLLVALAFTLVGYFAAKKLAAESVVALIIASICLTVQVHFLQREGHGIPKDSFDLQVNGIYKVSHSAVVGLSNEKNKNVRFYRVSESVADSVEEVLVWMDEGVGETHILPLPITPTTRP